MSNISVINYLENNSYCMKEYFEECYGEAKLPNYSEFCRKYLNGTTAEGVSFNSITIKRRELTSFLRNKYNLWVELQDR